MTPETATLKINDETLGSGNSVYIMDLDFDTELNLVTELTGYKKDEQKVTIKAEDNTVDINLVKDKVRQSNQSLLAFIFSFNFLSVVQA